MEELVIQGRFVLDDEVVTGYIGISDGKLVKLSKTPLSGEETIKLRPHEIVLPGMIDVHVHLRDFSQKEKETVESGTKAALHGGITTVFDMPNTNPPVMDAGTFRRRAELFRKKSYADYALGFLIAGNCSEVEKVEADFYKSFMGASTGGIYSRNFEEDYSCAKRRLSVHAEDYELIKRFPERPDIVEETAIKRALHAAKILKKPLNICHVSTAGGLQSIFDTALPWVSFEVTPHHLFLTQKDYGKNSMLKVYPPLRGESDRRALWRYFGRIPIIASDHAPHTLEDKEEGAAGIPGLETEVSLLLDAVNRGLVKLAEIVEKMHSNPIRIFGIKNKGFAVGKDADLIVVDLKKEWRVKPEEFYTRAKWSPWAGRKLKGRVKMTVLRGRVVMEDGEIIGKPQGVRINAQENRDKEG